MPRPWRLLRPSKGADGLLRAIPPVRCTSAGNAIHCLLSSIDEIENNSSCGTNVYLQSCDTLGTPFQATPLAPNYRKDNHSRPMTRPDTKTTSTLDGLSAWRKMTARLVLAGEELLHQRRQAPANRARDEVDPQRREGRRGVAEQRRAERPRRIQRSAGQRSPHRDARGQRQADRNRGERLSALPLTAER